MGGRPREELDTKHRRGPTICQSLEGSISGTWFGTAPVLVNNRAWEGIESAWRMRGSCDTANRLVVGCQAEQDAERPGSFTRWIQT